MARVGTWPCLACMTRGRALPRCPSTFSLTKRIKLLSSQYAPLSLLATNHTET